MKFFRPLFFLSIVLLGCSKVTDTPFIEPNESQANFGTYSGLCKFDEYSFGSGQTSYINVDASVSGGTESDKINLNLTYSNGDSRFYQDLRVVNKRVYTSPSNNVFIEIKFLNDETLEYMENALLGPADSETFYFKINKD